MPDAVIDIVYVATQVFGTQIDELSVVFWDNYYPTGQVCAIHDTAPVVEKAAIVP
jgi:hypothetical protein